MKEQRLILTIGATDFLLPEHADCEHIYSLVGAIIEALAGSVELENDWGKDQYAPALRQTSAVTVKSVPAEKIVARGATIAEGRAIVAKIEKPAPDAPDIPY